MKMIGTNIKKEIKSYKVKNKKLNKVLNEVEKLQKIVINSKNKQREYSIKVEKDVLTNIWNGEITINYEREKKNRVFEKLN
jgi:superfamily II RNA helicase